MTSNNHRINPLINFRYQIDKNDKNIQFIQYYKVKIMHITNDIIEKIINTAKEYGIEKLVLFGSAYDNPENANDIDLACDLEGMKIFSFAGRLEEELNILVDIVPLSKDNPFTEIILRKGKVLYEIN